MVPVVGVSDWEGLFSSSFILALVAFIIAIGAGTPCARQHDYKIDANQAAAGQEPGGWSVCT